MLSIFLIINIFQIIILTQQYLIFLLQMIAEQPLVGPDFLNSEKIDVKELKRRTFEEIMWFKNQQNLN